MLNIAILGPGQSPPMPQPTPNNADPPISFRSIWLKVGMLNSSEKIGFSILKTKLYPINAIIIPPTITKAKDGSHIPKIFRNDWTFEGLSMPDNVSPKPNNILVIPIAKFFM